MNKGPKRRRGGEGAGRPGAPVLPVLRRLAGMMKPHWRLLASVAATILVTTLLGLAPPWLIRASVDRFIVPGRREYIWWAAGGLLALSVLQGAVDFLRLYLMAYTGQRIVFEIRNTVFRHLSRLSFSFYDKARTGDLMSRVTADVDVLSQFFGRAAVMVLTNFLTLAGILVVLLIWNWRMGLLYLLLLPLIAFGIRTYAVRVRPAMGRMRRKLGELTALLQESLAGILVVKVFGREVFEQEKAVRQSAAFRKAGIETTRITSFWMPTTSVLMGIGIALVLWFGGRGVIAQTVSLGTLIGFTVYINMLFRPIRQTGMMMGVLMRSAAAAERVFEVLDTRPDIQDTPGAEPLPPVDGHIRFEGVSFSYDDRLEVLRNIDLDVQPGEMLALVGLSGAGKTTLVHLLPRFYDAETGLITIDGRDTRKVTIKSLRDAVGIALQTVFLFDASIGDNIAYGSPHAGRKEVEWAARAVQIADFIDSLPMGYDTPVGERGVRLSGGQKQRIALARVLLADPRIFILDEPTSSVDAETEQRMQQALQKVWAGRTTIVIAHRLWTVRQADHIVVLHEGRIVERGRRSATQSAHEILMAAGGPYSKLYNLQLVGETLPDDEEG